METELPQQTNGAAPTERDPLVAMYSRPESPSKGKFWKTFCCSLMRYGILFVFLLFLAILSLVFFALLLRSSSVLNSTMDSVSQTAIDIGTRLGLRIGGYSVDDSVNVPTLIVQVTIDQLRADEVMRLRRKFRKGPDWKGWNYLFKNGLFYRNSHFTHATTLTPAGHAALFTGGAGCTHGIVSLFFREDHATDKVTYCVADSRYHETSGKETINGTAPTLLASTTTGDELRLFTNESRVFSISEKDYVAIIQGGHLGKAFWWSTETGKYISSNYYYDEYPEYVTKWNAKDVPGEYQDKFWELSFPQEEYHFQNREYVNPGYDLGKVFPKPLHNPNRKDFIGTLLQTPYSDRIMLDFVEDLVKAENLGKREGVTDFLALSFSSNDKIGHNNGPNSLEKEDSIYKIDVLLNDLMTFLHDHLDHDADKILFILSSDHGVELAWKHSRDIGLGSDREFTGEVFMSDLNAYLNETYGGTLTSELLLEFNSPNLFLNYAHCAANNKDPEEVESLAAKFLLREYKEVAFVFTRSQLLENRIPDNLLVQKVEKTFHPKRSGDVFIIPREHVYMSTSHSSAVAMHGSPWSYDSYVPIFFMGKDIPKGEISDRRVRPEDIAVTLAYYIGLKAPSASIGTPLSEVLRLRDVVPSG